MATWVRPGVTQTLGQGFPAAPLRRFGRGARLDRGGGRWFVPSGMAEDLQFDDETQRILHRFGFDESTFGALRDRLRGQEGVDNVVRGQVAPPTEEDVVPLPPPGDPDRTRLTERGRAAMAGGEVGLVILAGGMATRFGGVVKAGVPVVDGRSFLALKLEDAARAQEDAGGRLPVYLMSSFATDEALRELAEEVAPPGLEVEVFPQFVSVRLTEDASVFRGDDGRPSLYAPGHGDLPFALQRAGILDRFQRAGGKVLFMSNVDNVTATADPAVVGAHLEGGARITVEVAPKAPGDRGGAPARIDGDPQIVETFRFPPDFDQDAIPVFNTNTMLFDVEVLESERPLTWFRVTKKVDGQPVIQFERLVGELTAFWPTRFLRIARTGDDARFQPVKDPAELEARTDEIARALRSRGLLPRA